MPFELLLVLAALLLLVIVVVSAPLLPSDAIVRQRILSCPVAVAAERVKGDAACAALLLCCGRRCSACGRSIRNAMSIMWRPAVN